MSINRLSSCYTRPSHANPHSLTMIIITMMLSPQVEGYAAAAKALASADPAGQGKGTAAAAAPRISTATRQLYSTQMLGPKVQLLCCDYRRGYLGKEQVAWLADTLKNSTATWKLVLTGAPFGVTMALPSSAAAAAANDVDVGAAESKEIDHLSTSVAADQQHQQPVVSPARMPRDEQSEAATVKMTLPPPIESAGCDEAGRYKLSLQAVIASLQKTAMSDNEKSKQLQQQEDARDVEAELATTDEIVNASSSSSAHQFIDAEGRQQLMQQGGGGLVVSLESGIVILSAGACVPEPSTAAAAFGDDATNATVSPAFVALYDPCGAGSPFCLEMCIGGGDCFDITDAPAAAIMSLGTGGGQQTSRPPPAVPSKPVSSLGPNVLFYHNDAAAAAPVACVAALASFDADSQALHLKLVAVAPDGQLDGQPLFACTLVQPTANNTSNNSPGNDDAVPPNPN